MAISISGPTYLKSVNNNIPLKLTWNESLIAGLHELADELNNSHLLSDIVEVEFTREDEWADSKAQGNAGYALDSPNNAMTGYYYIDFVHDGSGDATEYWYDNKKYMRELLDSLSKYTEDVDDFQYIKCSCFTDVAEDGAMLLMLRAFFVKNTRR